MAVLSHVNIVTNDDVSIFTPAHGDQEKFGFNYCIIVRGRYSQI